ncbi:DUF4288 domain-containing protein [Pedobacter deserti]|uniref:DUF4288 domain-containing protein n=1 Tax=Pedobacter deserti TaxID=2817382 RepID=UPI00210B5C4D|nr:DUF4288 domain-containing protein [Pedobacter sp. SYSU D00382]
MKWFLVKYIYEIVCSEGNYKTQFDEQLRLMIAEDAGEAFSKASVQGHSFHKPFLNCQGQLMEWRFIGVAGIHEIDEPADGAEVASIVHEPADVESFLNEMDQRKAFLLQ